MSTINEDGKQPENVATPKEQASACCGPGCGCGTAAGPGKMRYVIGALIMAVAGVLVVRAITKSDGKGTQAVASTFATPGAAETAAETEGSAQETGASGATSVGTSIGAFAELNTLAAKTDAVFVFLPGKDGKAVNAPSKMMMEAARLIETKAGKKCGLFTLKAGARDYDQVAGQVSLPAVLALVKGGGMSAVSGEITESKLVQSFVAASQSGSCAAGAGSSCCPAPK